MKLETNQTINLGVATYEAASIYRVVPNPVQNSLKINGKENTILQVSVFDSTGKQVISLPAYQTFTEIGTDFLRPGVYFIRIQENNQVQTLKFVKTD